MRIRPLCLLLGTCWMPPATKAQYSVGAQAGPLFSSGLGEDVTSHLSGMHGWMAGIQVVEGRTGQSGFRFGLDYGERSYHVRALNVNRVEDDTSVSSLFWLSTEMRWPLSRRFGLFFDLGPVIGFEIKEVRSGVSYYQEAPTGEADSTVARGEVERGFGIRDGHWRIGLSAQVPIAGAWRLTAGAHLCPGVGSWARGHGYATMDATLRVGFLYLISSKRKY